MSQEVVSFVLRFVRDASAEREARWRGTVKHVQGAAERQFTQFSDALAFMQSQLNEVAQAAAQSGALVKEHNPWLETAKLWGDFAPQYNRLMLEAVAKSAEASTEWTRSFWGGPREKRLEQKLSALSEQLERLGSTLAALQNDLADLKAAQDTKE